MIPVAVHAVERYHTEHHALRRLYSAYYYAVRDRHGRRAPGRNIRRFGVKSARGVRTATSRELARSIRTFRRWLHPAPVVAAVAASSPTVTASIAQPVTGGMPDCTWKPESGGSYTASNPSGAYGKYQIMPVHYGQGGVCAGMGKSPSEQEVCARRVFSSSGAGAWVNC